jgi:repressor LexA
MRPELSKRQREALDFIQAYHTEHKYAPSFADVASGIGLSKTTIVTYIDTLRKKDYVTWEKGIPRSLRLVKAE